MKKILKQGFHFLDNTYRRKTLEKRIRPSFLIIGAQKAGTSALFHYLLQHPDIGAPKQKEVHFFDKNFNKGKDWYLGQFPKHNSGLITGEASPFYLFHPDVPERVSQMFPEMKLIVVLREPVSRAFSHYQMELRRKRESSSFEEAISRELDQLGKVDIDDDFFQHKSYLARGRYAEQIENWLKYFDKNKLLALRSTDLQENIQEVLNGVYDFLEIESFIPKDLEARHVGGYPKLDDNLMNKLSSYFEGPNKELVSLLGQEFSSL